jgi:hypothetical protein
MAKGLQLVNHPRAHLYQPMPVPHQLPQITILRTRYPDSRKVLFLHQSQQQSDARTLTPAPSVPDKTSRLLAEGNAELLFTNKRGRPLSGEQASGESFAPAA